MNGLKKKKKHKTIACIYNGIIFNHKKEQVWVELRWMNLEPVMQNEVSQKEKKQMSYINAYTWNLEKWYWWTSFQGKNRDTDTENRLMEVVGEGKHGMNSKSNFETYTSPYAK